MFQDLGKVLIFLGLALAAAGLLLTWMPSLRLGRLPGDLHIRRENWSLHFPVVTCLLVSVALTLAYWLIQWFRR